MNKTVRLVALLLAALLITSGCSMVKINPKVDNETVLAEYTGGKVLKGEAQAEYDSMAAYYESYGYPIENKDEIASAKALILDYLCEQGVLRAKAQELGLLELTDEEKADITQKTEEEFDATVEMYMIYMSSGEEGETEETVRQNTIDYLADMGQTKEAAVEAALSYAWNDKLFAQVTSDVVASDEHVQLAYDELVAADEQTYASDLYGFEYAMATGATAAWFPEGYRTVKHILIGFTDDQIDSMADLNMQLEDVRYQIEEIDYAASEADPDLLTGDAVLDEDGHDHSQDEAVLEDEGAADAAIGPELTGAPEPSDVPDEEEPQLPTKSREELVAEEQRLSSEIEALSAQYALTLSDKVKEVQDKLAAGADFDALIAEYGTDPGMMEEPTKSTGYYVATGSEMWEEAFTKGAMALAAPGSVSGPITGSNGIHIIKYVADVTPGAVPIEQVRETVDENALQTANTERYDETVAQWVSEANVKTYPDRW